MKEAIDNGVDPKKFMADGFNEKIRKTMEETNK